MRYALLVIRFGLGVLLLFGGIAGIHHPFEFLQAVYGYQLTGPWLSVIVAGLLPWLEVVVGVCLISGVLTEGALLGATVLTALFTFAVSSAWHHGLSINCGCFGNSEDLINGYIVIRTVLLLATAGGGLVLSLTLARKNPLRTDLIKVDRPILRAARETKRRRNLFVSVPPTRTQSMGEVSISS